MQFTLTIDMDKAAFGDTLESRAEELYCILTEIRRKLRYPGPAIGDLAAIRDINGNTVGQWQIAETTPRVLIEVLGGVAELTECPPGVAVEIVDHDNEETEQ